MCRYETLGVAHRKSTIQTKLLQRVPGMHQLISADKFFHFRRLLAFLAVALTAITVTTTTASATGLEQPAGEILLTVSGNISYQNHEDGAVFDLQMLEAMPVTSFETNTPWTEGVTKFSGVRLDYLLEVVGAKSAMMKMIAEDGYIYDLEREINKRYPVIIAYKKNDEYMSLRQLGPLWVMFPFDDFPELATEENRAASVWQLKQMELK